MQAFTVRRGGALAFLLRLPITRVSKDTPSEILFNESCKEALIWNLKLRLFQV
jgi:hypothetical protein